MSTLVPTYAVLILTPPPDESRFVDNGTGLRLNGKAIDNTIMIPFTDRDAAHEYAAHRRSAYRPEFQGQVRVVRLIEETVGS